MLLVLMACITVGKHSLESKFMEYISYLCNKVFACDQLFAKKNRVESFNQRKRFLHNIYLVLALKIVLFTPYGQLSTILPEIYLL